MSYHQPKVKCELCQIEVLPTTLRRHITRIHKNERKFQCKICQKCFKLDYTLKVHVQSHNKKFKCQICSKKFSIQGRLNGHIKDYHENPNSFGCDVCGKHFNQNSILYSHKKIHDKNRPKPFKCQQCDFATDRMDFYKNHQNYHKKQIEKIAAMKNPVKCEKCSTYCKNKQSLASHKFNVHPKVLSQCDLCGSYFKMKLDLKRHIWGRVCMKNKNFLIKKV